MLSLKKKALAYFSPVKQSSKTPLNNQIGTISNKSDMGNIHNKYRTEPKWTIGKSQRKPLHLKVWTTHETYALPSSVGIQKLSIKVSQPQTNFGKATREEANKVGIYPTAKSKLHANIFMN